jgi:hypothetical protein
MAEFVRAEILGTKFEYTTRHVSRSLLLGFGQTAAEKIKLVWLTTITRYVNPQPIGMGSFGLVWYVLTAVVALLTASTAYRY